VNPFRLRPRKPFLPLTLAGIAGITAADFFALPAPATLATAAVLALITFLVPNRAACLALTATAFASLHAMRHVEHPATHFAASLAVAPAQVRANGVVWSEPESFVDGRGFARASFWMKIEELQSAGGPVRGTCLVGWRGVAPALGDRITIAGSAEPLPAPGNPGVFNTAAWLRRQGIHFQIAATSAADCAISGHGAAPWWRELARNAREWITARLDLGQPGNADTAALIHSMVLGMRGETPVELKDLFQKTGTLHLFAVSGLNVAMLAAIAWYALKPLQIGRKGAALFIVPLLIAYAIVTGLGASCVRATVMGALILLAPVAERRAVVLNSIAAAAFAILAWDTNQLFSPGFQLSFVLVLAILLLAVPIQRRMEPLAAPDDFIPERLWTHTQRVRLAVWKLFAATAGVTVAAWLGSLLFMAGYFHLFSPSAIIANLLAVPLAFLVLALGLLSLVAGAAFIPLAMAINHANALCASALITVVSAFAKLPGGHVYIEIPRATPSPVCEVTMLDVGEGAAIHIRAGGDWLLDAGHAVDYTSTLLPYLRSRGVNQLDGLLLSHGDSAHIGGAAMLLDDFQPRWIAEHGAADRSPVRRALHAELASRGQGRRFLRRGDQIVLSPDVKVRVLYPPDDVARPLADDRAVVFMLESAGQRVLIVGDAAFTTEQWLLANEPDLHADVLIKGWPKRDLSGTPDFISRVAPRIIACAAQEFGTPLESFDQWAAPFRARGIKLLHQAECGAVRLSLFPAEMRVEKWNP
jgi:competence protein ComEC